jgi:hypothetical protein
MSILAAMNLPVGLQIVGIYGGEQDIFSRVFYLGTFCADSGVEMKHPLIGS